MPLPCPAPASIRTVWPAWVSSCGADRQHRDAVLVRLDLLGHADDHPLDLRSRWRNRSVELGCESRLMARAIRPDSSPKSRQRDRAGHEMGRAALLERGLIYSSRSESNSFTSRFRKRLATSKCAPTWRSALALVR